MCGSLFVATRSSSCKMLLVLSELGMCLCSGLAQGLQRDKYAEVGEATGRVARQEEPKDRAARPKEPKEGASTVYFNAYDSDVLALLPPFIQEQLPFVATERGAIDKRLLGFIKILMVRDGSATAARDALWELAHIEHYQHYLQYLQTAAHLRSGAAPDPVPYSPGNEVPAQPKRQAGARTIRSMYTAHAVARATVHSDARDCTSIAVPPTQPAGEAALQAAQQALGGQPPPPGVEHVQVPPQAPGGQQSTAMQAAGAAVPQAPLQAPGGQPVPTQPFGAAAVQVGQQGPGGHPPPTQAGGAAALQAPPQAPGNQPPPTQPAAVAAMQVGQQGPGGRPPHTQPAGVAALQVPRQAPACQPLPTQPAGAGAVQVPQQAPDGQPPPTQPAGAAALQAPRQAPGCQAPPTQSAGAAAAPVPQQGPGAHTPATQPAGAGALQAPQQALGAHPAPTQPAEGPAAPVLQGPGGQPALLQPASCQQPPMQPPPPAFGAPGDDMCGPRTGVYVPSSQYIRSAFVRAVEADVPHHDRFTSSLDCSILKIDHTFTAARKVQGKVGDRKFEALCATMNEHAQPIGHWYTQTKSMQELDQQITALADRLQRIQQVAPNLLVCCLDR